MPLIGMRSHSGTNGYSNTLRTLEIRARFTLRKEQVIISSLGVS